MMNTITPILNSSAVSDPHIFLFFLILRPPPSSTLFPYTTLFRSSAGSESGSHSASSTPRPAGRRVEDRSEEHTSELQSRFDLVCRLLLEKKKKVKWRSARRSRERRRAWVYEKGDGE